MRFDPYWKLQLYERSAWTDVQKAYDDRGDATQDALERVVRGQRVRLMLITAEGRTPQPEIVAVA